MFILGRFPPSAGRGMAAVAAATTTSTLLVAWGRSTGLRGPILRGAVPFLKDDAHRAHGTKTVGAGAAVGGGAWMARMAVQHVTGLYACIRTTSLPPGGRVSAPNPCHEDNRQYCPLRVFWVALPEPFSFGAAVFDHHPICLSSPPKGARPRAAGSRRAIPFPPGGRNVHMSPLARFIANHGRVLRVTHVPTPPRQLPARHSLQGRWSRVHPCASSSWQVSATTWGEGGCGT